ncbi:MAG TPA: hypothetical protein VNC50_13895 [Planctomycetia bacterium]|nr:hypothetical protein [Planctomycetia bacterium]
MLESVPDEEDENGLSVDDPDFIAELRRRADDKSPTVSWDEIMREVGRKP